MQDTNITIIIPTFGGTSLLERTLTSLAKCNFPQIYSKTIIVENGPKYEAEYICKKFNNINCEYQYISTANKSIALNYALNFVDDNSFVIFFDDDIRLSIDTIIAYNNAFQKFGGSFFYGGPFDVDYQKKPSKELIQFLPLSAIGWSLEQQRKLGPFDLFGCNWAVCKNHLLKVGGFNERFGPNSTSGATGQEHDMMCRLNEMGVRPLYVSDALVWHYVPMIRSSFKWLMKRKYKDGISEGIRNSDLDEKIIRKKCVSYFKLLLKHSSTFNKTGVIKYLLGLNKLRGIYHGIRFKKNENTIY